MAAWTCRRVWRTGFALPARVWQLPREVLHDPRVQTFSFRSGGERHPPVQLWTHPDDELPGEGLFWLLAPLGAESQVIVDRVPERAPQFLHGLALKGHHVPDV